MAAGPLGSLLRGATAFAVVLLVGTLIAFVGQPAAPAAAPLGFGDHAEYDVTVVDLDTGQAVGANVTRLSVEVGAAATVAAESGRPVLAVPLEFRFAIPTLDGRPGQVARTFWLDGATVVAVGDKGTGSVALGGPSVGGSELAESSRSMAWSGLDWGWSRLPCGFSLAPEGVQEEADAGHALAGATAVLGADCQVERKAGIPWPTAIVGPLADLLGSPGPGRVAHRLDLAESGRSLAAWSSPAAVAALPPAQAAPRGVLGPAGEGPGPFALDDAFEAVRSAPADPAARDLLGRHPDAFVAYARAYTAVDGTGQQQHAWHMVLVGGGDRVERVAVQEPELAPLLPGAVRVVRPSDLDYAVEAPPTVLASKGLAPSTLPALDGLRLAFAAATGREPTAWGFSIACTSRSCFEVEARLVLLAEDLAPAEPSAVHWQRSVATSDRLEVDGDGTLLRVSRVEQGRPVPDLLAQGPLEPSEAPSPGRIAFPFESTPAAMAVGLLGLVAAAIAAAWPALKVYLPLFSRIETSRLLDHPVRRRVHDLVHSEPGIHARQVSQRLGIAGNTANHHLARLVGAGYLGERHIGGYHCYFPRGGLDERLQDALPVLKSQGAQAVLLAMESQGAPSFRSLMATTGLGYATVHMHAERLWKAGLCSSERDGKARRFRLTELGRVVAQQAQASLGRFPKLPKNAPEMDGTA